MNQHSPHDPIPRPDPTTTDPGADLVPGEPPVPLTVWRTASTPADAGRGVGARLAARLVAAYSRPGEPVVDLTDGHALARPCGAGARRHHPAWFTEVSSLIIGPATPPPPTTAAGEPGDGDQPEEAPELRAWFGDDLTDPDLPPPAAPAGPLAGPGVGGSLDGATSLVVAGWPLDAADAANRVRLAWLLTACAGLLRPGGCLILVVPAAAGGAPQDFTGVVQAAAGVRLGYLQHIVAVTADADGDAFVYHVSDEELLTLATARWPMAHRRVQADLLVFSRPQPAPVPTRTGPRTRPAGRATLPAPARARVGGGRRG
jgi:hypothetical protein